VASVECDTNVVVGADTDIRISTHGTITVDPWKILTVKGGMRLQHQSLPCYIDSTAMLWYKDGGVPDDPAAGYKTFSDDLTLKADTIYTDGVFTYTKSGAAGKYLYTRTRQRMFFPPNLLDIGTDSKAMDNVWGPDIVDSLTYIAPYGLKAMTIYNVDTLGSPNVQLMKWERSSSDSAFFSTGVSISIIVNGMEGNRSYGYYITESDYKNSTSGTTRGMAFAFQYSTGCVTAGMANYDPYLWKKWDDVVDEFVSDHPYLHYQAPVWYQVGHISSSATRYFGIFRTIPDPVDDPALGDITNLYSDVQNTGKCYYIKSDDTSTPAYHMALKVWSTDTCHIRSGIDQDVGNTISSEQDSMVYIKGGNALGIYKLGTLGNPEMRIQSYKKSSDKFNVSTTYKVSVSLAIRAIGDNYYVPCGSDDSLGRYIYSSAGVNVDLSNYDPSGWRPWDEVAEQFA
jgi:hypothetical protein